MYELGRSASGILFDLRPNDERSGTTSHSASFSRESISSHASGRANSSPRSAPNAARGRSFSAKVTVACARLSGAPRSSRPQTDFFKGANRGQRHRRPIWTTRPSPLKRSRLRRGCRLKLRAVRLALAFTSCAAGRPPPGRPRRTERSSPVQGPCGCHPGRRWRRSQPPSGCRSGRRRSSSPACC